MKTLFITFLESLTYWALLSIISIAVTFTLFISSLSKLVARYGKNAQLADHFTAFELIIFMSVIASTLVIFILVILIRGMQINTSFSNDAHQAWNEINLDFISKLNSSITVIATTITAFLGPFFQGKPVSIDQIIFVLPLLAIAPLSIAISLVKSLSRQE